MVMVRAHIFYHSDHLGGANWITDASGHPIQHLQYLPFGNHYIDQRVAGSTYQERFRFTGKERDEETGYGYFGARYMDHELMTGWLSVDPMSDKYPSVSPYNYCMWNPVKLVDLDGMDTTISINLNDGTVGYNYDPDNFNGTFVELIGNETTIETYKCYGEVSKDPDDGSGRDIVTFSDNRDASSTFYKIAGRNDSRIESAVEWNYYEQKNGTGVLMTSHQPRAINIAGLSQRFNRIKSRRLHHYHPKGAGVAWWTPSESDQRYSLELGIPCILHFSGQEYRFDDIVRIYGVMDYERFQKHIPLTINKFQ